MTQGVAYSRQGPAGDPTFNSAGFKDDVRAFFGSGTGLQELYIQPGKLTAEDWHVLAEAAKWSRANADVLVDTHWIGGDPAQAGGLWLCLVVAAQGHRHVPQPRRPAAGVRLRRRSRVRAARRGGAQVQHSEVPGRRTGTDPHSPAKRGKPLRLTLKPFEVVVFEALPAN